ncbi:DNA polymerase III, alpha subunit [Haemophilus influenzae HK1212]|uniref:DNA polymerase III subunit alpha n=1 Tax=Haemophilus influenzae HK1212 TaxID=456482 RepID=A0A7G2JZL3_HAEIF|nr:DNA polymerase III, alpha subunit [Haemophilus influenzae HK1212]
MSSQPRFVHLRTHTDFSMIDSIVKVKPLVKACAANEMVAMGLTDFTNFCGVVRFYGEMLSSGMKPIQLVVLNAITCVDFAFVFAHKNAKCLAIIKTTKTVKSSVLIGFALLIMFS